MSAIMIEIPIQPRLLTKAEAARYCRLGLARFTARCPVQAIEIDDNKRVYDRQELDGWIDSLKKGNADTEDEILSKLGGYDANSGQGVQNIQRQARQAPLLSPRNGHRH